MLAIADVAIVVSDAKSSARWWKEKVGFAIQTIGGTGHAVLVAPPGDRFVLHMCEGIAPVEPGNTGIAFITDEIDAMVERMVDAGVEFPEPLKRETRGGRAKFSDPDGNVFWLMEAPKSMVQEVLNSRAPQISGSRRRKGHTTKASGRGSKRRPQLRGKPRR